MGASDKLEVRCACGKRYRVPADRAGRQARCRACGGMMQVPFATPPEPSAVSSRLRPIPQPATKPPVGQAPYEEDDPLAALASAGESGYTRPATSRCAREKEARQHKGLTRAVFFILYVSLIGVSALLRSQGMELYGQLPLFALVAMTAFRLGNIGISGWWALMMFIALPAVVLMPMCLAMPTGWAQKKRLDTVGLVVMPIALVVHIGLLVASVFFAIEALEDAREYTAAREQIRAGSLEESLRRFREDYRVEAPPFELPPIESTPLMSQEDLEALSRFFPSDRRGISNSPLAPLNQFSGTYQDYVYYCPAIGVSIECPLGWEANILEEQHTAWPFGEVRVLVVLSKFTPGTRVDENLLLLLTVHRDNAGDLRGLDEVELERIDNENRGILRLMFWGKSTREISDYTFHVHKSQETLEDGGSLISRAMITSIGVNFIQFTAVSGGHADPDELETVIDSIQID